MILTDNKVAVSEDAQFMLLISELHQNSNQTCLYGTRSSNCNHKS